MECSTIICGSIVRQIIDASNEEEITDADASSSVGPPGMDVVTAFGSAAAKFDHIASDRCGTQKRAVCNEVNITAIIA